VVDGQKLEVDSRDEGKHTGRNDPLFDEAVRVAVGMRLGLSLCSKQLSLRDLSGCPRSSCHGLQEGTGQNRKTTMF